MTSTGRLYALASVLFLGSPAFAQPRDSAPGSDDTQADTSNWFNVRIGGATLGADDYAVICVEATPWKLLSLETCGTGAGLFRELRGVDVAHFRAKWSVFQHKQQAGQLRVQAGLGVAELEVGPDEPGLSFGRLPPNAVETAGPEATASIQYLMPLGHGVEALLNLTAGFAWMPYAPDLVNPQDEWQPFVGFDVGAGW